MANHLDDAESTLQAFHEAHERRLQLLARGDADAAEAIMALEREAICRHAAAVRAHAERLARFGR
jgi:hypothetical protein